MSEFESLRISSINYPFLAYLLKPLHRLVFPYLLLFNFENEALRVFHRLILDITFFSLPVFSSTVKWNDCKKIQTTATGGVVYELGGTTYFANSKNPKAALSGKGIIANEGIAPITVIVSNNREITGKYLESTVSGYLDGDDVFSKDFLESVYISSSSKQGSIHSTALQYLASLGIKNLYLDSKICSEGNSPISFKSVRVSGGYSTVLPSGPYTAVISEGDIQVLTTYRLYRDEYRNFITGAYEDGEGSFSALEVMNSQWWDPMIPVPSRIYSWSDDRELAGMRVAIKDLYDMKGLQTGGGSQAWIAITPIANTTAPSIQRLVNLRLPLYKYKY